MMKSTQKGNQYEREVRDILKAQGWHVEGQHRKVMWLRDKHTGQMKMIMSGRDIYGCDLIAKKKGDKTRWIQVSTLGQKSAKQRQVLEFSWTLAYESVELWLRLEGKRSFRVFKLQESGIFVEDAQQDLKRKNNEEDTDGIEGSAEKVAEEYPG